MRRSGFGRGRCIAATEGFGSALEAQVAAVLLSKRLERGQTGEHTIRAAIEHEDDSVAPIEEVRADGEEDPVNRVGGPHVESKRVSPSDAERMQFICLAVEGRLGRHDERLRVDFVGV